MFLEGGTFFFNSRPFVQTNVADLTWKDARKQGKLDVNDWSLRLFMLVQAFGLVCCA